MCILFLFISATGGGAVPVWATNMQNTLNNLNNNVNNLTNTVQQLMAT